MRDTQEVEQLFWEDRKEARNPFPKRIRKTPRRLEEWGRVRAGFHTTIRCKTAEEHRNWLLAKWLHEDGLIPMGSCTTFLSLFLPTFLAPFYNEKKVTSVKIRDHTIINYGPFFMSFNYNPKRPKRSLPGFSIRSKKGFARTVSNRAEELYALWKVSDLERTFSYLDLGEFSPEYARKLILRLKRKGWIRNKGERSKPQYYECLIRLQLKPTDPNYA